MIRTKLARRRRMRKRHALGALARVRAEAVLARDRCSRPGLSERKPARKHRGEDAILEDNMMVKRGERVDSGEPENCIAQPGMYSCDLRANVMRRTEKGRYFQPADQCQRVGLEPRARDCRKRQSEEKQV